MSSPSRKYNRFHRVATTMFAMLTPLDVVASAPITNSEITFEYREFSLQNNELIETSGSLTFAPGMSHRETTVISSSHFESFTLTLDNNYALVQKEVSINDASYQKILNQTSRTVVVEPGTEWLDISIAHLDNTRSQQRFDYSGAVPQGALEYLLYESLHNEVSVEQIEMFADSNGMNFKLNIQRLDQINLPDHPLVSSLPEALAGCLRAVQDPFVFQARFGGFIGLFVDTRYYYVFDSQRPYALLGKWGGESEDLSISINKALYPAYCDEDL